jgi:signal transduction histidine kinase
MDVAATIATTSAVLGVYVGLLSRRLSDAPGSRDQRRFGVVAFSAAAFSLCSLASALVSSPPAVVAVAQLQVAAAFVQLWGWARYSQAFVERRPERAERLGCGALLAGAALALVPGLLFQGTVLERPFPAFGTIYREPVPTTVGPVLLLAGAAGAVPILVRFVRAWRAGVPHAGALALAFAAVILLGLNDVLASAGVLDTPYLLDLAFAAPVAGSGWIITARFVESARALEALRGRLLAEVESRTRELSTALDALHQAEKLAALGQFANGVAHEVNSPASVVMTNLRYLAEASRSGAFPDDAADVVSDALESMKRINDLVRKLSDAGRIASPPGPAAAVPLAEVASQVAAGARERVPRQITVEAAVPEGIFVRARREALEQVLASLVANASEAIPRGRAGRIAIRAERINAAIRIAVSDDGAGMRPEVLRRALDPFFTTKPAGQGSGLGLPVARGLVEAHGGMLWLESSPGIGTTAFVELPEVRPTPAPAPQK